MELRSGFVMALSCLSAEQVEFLYRKYIPKPNIILYCNHGFRPWLQLLNPFRGSSFLHGIIAITQSCSKEHKVAQRFNTNVINLLINN